MYQFPDQLRKTYESMRIPFAMYQYLNRKIVPVLVSDGLCDQMGMNREKLMKLLAAGQYESMHPDDAGQVRRVSKGFAEHKNNYDVFFRRAAGHVPVHWRIPAYS